MGDHNNTCTQQQTNNDSSVHQLLNFTPPTMLRVLLVEPDDSTRHIISALLRKCGYKVAAVRDGLKACETLKNKSPHIDLVLTEIDLPSISGFTLLTSIMDHDNCKNIPVIMMSTHDSVSTVFKCMRNGAVDFLIKPVRRNELRNLWQHVWRRNTISSTPPQNITFPQNKLEVAAENKTASNNSSGSVASTQQNIKHSENTSEAQGISQLMSSSSLSNSDQVKYGNSTKYERESAEYNDKPGEISTIITSKDAGCDKVSTGLRLGQSYDYSEIENKDEVLRTELSKANPHTNTKILQCNEELEEHSARAVDFMATFENLPKRRYENCGFNGGNTARFDFDTPLELSSQRDFSGISPEPTTEERQKLNHSNASAFSWYGSSTLLQPLFPTKNSQELLKSSENTNTTHLYDGKQQNQENITYLVNGQSGQVDAKFQNSQFELFPATGATSDDQLMNNDNVLHSLFSTQSSMNPTHTSKSVFEIESSPFPTSISSQSNPKSQNSEPHHWSDDATYTCDQNLNDQSNIDCAHSPSNGRSHGTKFYHDVENHNSSAVCEGIGSGSDENSTSVVAGKNNLESSMNNDHYDGLRGANSHRSSQREAALTKFRLKRKDRCYDKKVRYESRKRQADNRPRVKGQFVRQVHGEFPIADYRAY